MVATLVVMVILKCLLQTYLHEMYLVKHHSRGRLSPLKQKRGVAFLSITIALKKAAFLGGKLNEKPNALMSQIGRKYRKVLTRHAFAMISQNLRSLQIYRLHVKETNLGRMY